MVESIHCKNARFETVTVTVQTVRIGAKQMTISVFRQLPTLPERHFNAAEKWGYVRYDIDGFGAWFVVVHDQKLFRYGVDTSSDAACVRRVLLGVRQQLDEAKANDDMTRASTLAEGLRELQCRLDRLTLLETSPQLFISV